MIDQFNISLHSLIVQSEGNIVSDMDGEKVMLSVHQGKYYNLGTTGGVIWEHIQSPTSVAQLIEVLTAEYAVQQTECQQQVFSFLELLLQEGLIRIEEEK
jgi:hypothetical protein